MHKRPVHDLVEALHQIGFRINYLGQPGFPPIEIIPINLDSLNNKVSIDGSISSQFISSLMMIGASLPQGLAITITGEIASKPYILLTAALMRKAGIESAINFPRITIAKQEYKNTILSAGDDWTNASYWFALVALWPSVELILEGLEEDSAQGDKILLEWGKYFGVKSEFKQGALHLSKLENWNNETLHFDFTPHPDLAQTIIVLCAAKGIQATFSGLQSLRIKETDRIAALQTELKKFDVALVETANGNFTLEGKFVARPVTIETYNDHRMAMCFAPLAVLAPITFTDPSVVTKSYPDFWNQMAKLLTWD
jgi:3-phosphoshikimate 1-carboxyvinyltransferase